MIQGEEVGNDLTKYLTLHQYVLDYQEGKPGSADNILNCFKGYVLNFVYLIKHGTFDIEDFSIRQFVSLYITDDFTKRNILKYKYSPFVRATLYYTAKKLWSMFSCYSDIEIKNEFSVIILQMAKRYKDYDRPSFHNYVNRCFHYEAFRSLELLIKDPIVRWQTMQEYNDDEAYIDIQNHKIAEDMALTMVDYDAVLIKSAMPTIKGNHSPFEISSLDDNWVNGITSTESFNCLSPFERSVIKLHYVDKLTDTKIADMYGLCRATINRKRLIAERSLSVKLTTKKV